MLLKGPNGSPLLLNASGASENVGPFSAGDFGQFLKLDVTVDSAPVFTIKVAVRAVGAGTPAPTGAGVAAGTYTGFLAFTNDATGATVAGATGITGAGTYTFDVSGLDFQIEYVRASGGTVTAKAALYRVG